MGIFFKEFVSIRFKSGGIIWVKNTSFTRFIKAHFANELDETLAFIRIEA